MNMMKSNLVSNRKKYDIKILCDVAYTSFSFSFRTLALGTFALALAL